MIGCFFKIMRREWRLLVGWGWTVPVCHAAGVASSIHYLDPVWYFFMPPQQNEWVSFGSGRCPS